MFDHKISGIPESPLGTQSGVLSNPTKTKPVSCEYCGETIEFFRPPLGWAADYPLLANELASEFQSEGGWWLHDTGPAKYRRYCGWDAACSFIGGKGYARYCTATPRLKEWAPAGPYMQSVAAIVDRALFPSFFEGGAA